MNLQPVGIRAIALNFPRTIPLGTPPAPPLSLSLQDKKILTPSTH
jgi:hypothetical protein